MISLELWRANIGLFNCSCPPSSSLFTNLHHQQQSVTHGWFLAGGGSAGLFSSLCRSLLIKRALVLLLVPVISYLLLLAGDVEQNPGPLTAGSPLTVKNLLEACRDVTDWHGLGRQLGLTMSKLKGIEITYYVHGVERLKAEMFDVWLKSDPNASWTELITALMTMDLTLAKEIEAAIGIRPAVTVAAGAGMRARRTVQVDSSDPSAGTSARPSGSAAGNIPDGGIRADYISSGAIGNVLGDVIQHHHHYPHK